MSKCNHERAYALHNVECTKVTVKENKVHWKLSTSPTADRVNPTEVIVRQMGVQPAHTTADINSSAAALTQGHSFTHTAVQLRLRREKWITKPRWFRTHNLYLWAAVFVKLYSGVCVCVCGSGVRLMHMRIWRRQLPGDGQGALPSASEWIKEKPPVILASL